MEGFCLDMVRFYSYVASKQLLSPPPGLPTWGTVE